MLKWIKEKLKQWKQRKNHPRLAEINEILELEEEAVKRVKRINELRDEVERANRKAVTRGLKAMEERKQAPESEEINSKRPFSLAWLDRIRNR